MTRAIFQPVVVKCPRCGRIKKYGEWMYMPPKMQLETIEGKIEFVDRTCQDCQTDMFIETLMPCRNCD